MFCDNKESGKAFAASLNVPHQYLDADSKGSAEWAALLKNQRFECCALVCTQAIDTGINIHDPKLKHVCVITDDHTTFLQMIGRKRCTPGETYTVHVVEFSGKKLGIRAQRAKELLDLLEEYDTSDAAARSSMATRFWNMEDSQVRKCFHLIGGKLYPNDLAFHKLRRQYRFFEQLRGFYEDHPERLPEMGPEGVNHRLSYLRLPYCVKKCRKNLWLRANSESPEEP